MLASKKLAVLGTSAVLSIALFTSCGTQTAPSNVDHAKVMQEARAKLVTEISDSIDKNMEGETSGTLTGNAMTPMGSVTFKGDVSSMQAKTSADMSNSAIKLGLTFDADLSSLGKTKGELSLEMRQLEKMFYATIAKLSATSDNADLKAKIDQVMPMVSMYTGKWFKLDLAELAKTTGKESPFMAGSDMKLMKEITALIKDYEIFERVETMPMENGMYVYKVKPNSAELVKLVKAISLKSDPSATMTATDEANMKTAFDALGDSRITHLLYIDSKDNTYKKLVSKGTITNGDKSTDVAFEASSKEPGKSMINLTLTMKEGSISLTANLGKTAGDFAFLVDAPSQKVKIDVKGQATFKEGKPTITAPESAEDLMGLIGGMMGAAATAPAVDMNAGKGDETVPTGEPQ